MGNWIPFNRRGLIIGIWCVNVNIGNMLGDMVGGLFIDKMNLNWGWVILLVGAVELFICIFMLLFLQPYPEKVGCVI